MILKLGQEQICIDVSEGQRKVHGGTHSKRRKLVFDVKGTASCIDMAEPLPCWKGGEVDRFGSSVNMVNHGGVHQSNKIREVLKLWNHTF